MGLDAVDAFARGSARARLRAVAVERLRPRAACAARFGHGERSDDLRATLLGLRDTALAAELDVPRAALDRAIACFDEDALPAKKRGSPQAAP